MLGFLRVLFLPLFTGLTATGLAIALQVPAQPVVQQVSGLTHEVLYVGIGLVVSILTLAGTVAYWGGRVKQQVAMHERRLWVIEHEGSPAVQKLTALLDRECVSTEEILRRVADIDARLVRVETVLRIMPRLQTQPLDG